MKVGAVFTRSSQKAYYSAVSGSAGNVGEIGFHGNRLCSSSSPSTRGSILIGLTQTERCRTRDSLWALGSVHVAHST